jgi:hypothetical protein
MTTDPRFVRECGRKKKYPTEAIAEKVRQDCEVLRGVALRIYQCSWCQLWHLSSSPRAQDS